MSKARRPQDSDKYVLCEEVLPLSSADKETTDVRNPVRRILADEENVQLAQFNWKNNVGKFILLERTKALEV